MRPAAQVRDLLVHALGQRVEEHEALRLWRATDGRYPSEEEVRRRAREAQLERLLRLRAERYGELNEPGLRLFECAIVALILELRGDGCPEARVRDLCERGRALFFIYARRCFRDGPGAQ